ncbi:hypothetical protein Hypma_013895 [Hypsizygus marmoreus]|uniref:Uncharacterized protein n=1 Tax=Hypsizygus marmoreus TaxID=39966 RepID=A0A369KDL2_HYPMA|nr:hypothetical protein Hypma_013895 [Hypsizygus marmoreus]
MKIYSKHWAKLILTVLIFLSQFCSSAESCSLAPSTAIAYSASRSQWECSNHGATEWVQLVQVRVRVLMPSVFIFYIQILRLKSGQQTGSGPLEIYANAQMLLIIGRACPSNALSKTLVSCRPRPSSVLRRLGGSDQLLRPQLSLDFNLI